MIGTSVMRPKHPSAPPLVEIDGNTASVNRGWWERTITLRNGRDEENYSF